MVTDQIQARGLTDDRVLAALLKVPRHQFVPENLRDSAYGDYPLDIGYGQTISQPYIVAFMTAALGLQPQDRVLEVGTGSGYQTAVLAEVVGQVFSLEIIPSLAARAGQRLQGLGYQNVDIRQGDGYQGWLAAAPFTAILVAAAPPEIPPSLVEQLAVGGKMIIPVGVSQQELVLLTKTPSGVTRKSVLPVRFVPLVKGAG